MISGFVIALRALLIAAVCTTVGLIVASLLYAISGSILSALAVPAAIGVGRFVYHRENQAEDGGMRR